MSLSVDGFWKAGFWTETFWADGFWQEETLITGTIDVTEEDDVLTGIGFVVQNLEGIISVIEDDDVLIATGTIEIKFVIDVLDLNLTIPKADEDAAEQQRILIENMTLIQQALRNLGQ